MLQLLCSAMASLLVTNTTYFLIQYVASISYSSLTILANSFLILAILLHPSLRNHRQNIFMLSLSIANLLVGFAFSLKVLEEWYNPVPEEDPKHPFLCRFMKGLIILAISSSIYNFLALASDRWIMVKHPDWRKTPMPMVVLIVWVPSLLQALPLWTNFHDVNYLKEPLCSFRAMRQEWLIFSLATIFVLPTLLLLLHYLTTGCRTGWGFCRSFYIDTATEGNLASTYRLYSLICLIFLVCWWPVIIYVWVVDLTSSGLEDPLAVNLAKLSSLIDPLLYMWLNESVRCRVLALPGLGWAALGRVANICSSRREEGYERIQGYNESD